MEVAVRDLKDRLSEFLRRAQAGEEILVTSHGRPIVRMIGIDQSASGEADAVARLRALPWVRAGGGPVVPMPSPIRPAGPGEPLLSDLLIEDRE